MLGRMMKGKNIQGAVFALAGGVGWGFSGACAQFLFANYAIDSLWMSAVRMLCAGVVLVVVAFVRNRSELCALWSAPRDIAVLFLFAIAGLAFCQASYLIAIEHSNAGTATVLQYIGPVLVVVFSCFRGHRKPEPREVCAMAFVVVGTYLLATHGNPATMVLTPAGLTWGLLAALSLALYTMIPVGLMRRYGSLPVVACGTLIGGVALCAATQAWSVPVALDGAGLLAMFGGVTLIGAVLGFTAYLHGVSLIGAAKASLLGSVETVSATLFAVLWLGTAFSGMDAVGFAFIVATVFLLTKKPSEQRD